jgi:hypothetical protein
LRHVRPNGSNQSSVREAADRGAVRPLAALALASGTIEADVSADLRPMRRVEPAQFGSDRHRPEFQPLS